jgi:hypothetical protein
MLWIVENLSFWLLEADIREGMLSTLTHISHVCNLCRAVESQVHPQLFDCGAQHSWRFSTELHRCCFT